MNGWRRMKDNFHKYKRFKHSLRTCSGDSSLKYRNMCAKRPGGNIAREGGTRVLLMYYIILIRTPSQPIKHSIDGIESSKHISHIVYSRALHSALRCYFPFIIIFSSNVIRRRRCIQCMHNACERYSFVVLGCAMQWSKAKYSEVQQ